MAINAASTYGLDIACIRDADELWSEVSGIELIRQDTIHVITCEDFIGPKGNKRGFDVRTLIGKKQGELSKYGPTVSEVITRDERIPTADVTFTATTNSRGLLDVLVNIICMTAFGPFSIVKLASELTADDIGGSI